MIAPIRRLLGSAWTHRAAAFLAVVVGGGLLGSAVRRAGSASEYGLLGQTYLAGWLWRSGVSLASLYDPDSLRAAMAEIQPDGPVLSAPWLQPPALALLGWPFTLFTLEGARGAFLWIAILLLLLGLVGLGSRRAGGWNRTDWLFLAGVTLASRSALLATRDLEPTPVSFALGAWLLAAVESRRRVLAAILALALAPISGTVWIVLFCFAIAKRTREAIDLAVALFLGIGLAILCLGWAPHLAFFEALARGTALPQVAAPSLPAQIEALFPGSVTISWAGSAVVLAAGLWMMRRMAPFEHPLWRGLAVSWGMLLGALVLPAALPSRGLLAIPAIWSAGRIAVAGGVSFARWIALFASAALVMAPWPAAWLTGLGVGSGAPVVAGEVGILIWIWRAATDPVVRRHAMESVSANSSPAPKREHPARIGSTHAE